MTDQYNGEFILRWNRCRYPTWKEWGKCKLHMIEKTEKRPFLKRVAVTAGRAAAKSTPAGYAALKAADIAAAKIKKAKANAEKVKARADKVKAKAIKAKAAADALKDAAASKVKDVTEASEKLSVVAATAVYSAQMAEMEDIGGTPIPIDDVNIVMALDKSANDGCVQSKLALVDYFANLSERYSQKAQLMSN